MLKITLLIIVLLLGIQPSFAKSWGNPSTPQYYTFEDLKSAASNYRGDFSFRIELKPFNAVASLPSKTPDGQALWIATAKAALRRALGGPTFLAFPWNDNRISAGDVVFIRGGDAVSHVIRCFSTWTHTAMVYNKIFEQSFESQNEKGVNIYDYKAAWPKIVAYAVKEVNLYNPMQYVRASYSKYAGKKYFPPLFSTNSSLRDFFRKWGDKMDLDSMYCAKLVWWTFRDGADLDSERTSSSLYGKEARMDYGTMNSNAWIGVSPDDIYYSQNVGRDLVAGGLDKLGDPLLGSVF